MGWIKCSESLPSNESYVLVCNGVNVPLVMQFFIKHNDFGSEMYFQQTLIYEGEDNGGGSRFSLNCYSLWHPLPEPPTD